MLAAYFDASMQRTPDAIAKEVICVGGFLSPASKWKRFQRKWRKLLYSERLDFFHMTDFENYKGPYKNWNREQHERFLRTAFSIIRSTTNFAFASAVVLDDFKQAKKIDARLQSMSAFTFCVIQCLHAIKEQENKFGYNGNIAYVFESGDPYGNELRMLEREINLDSTKKKLFRLGSWTVGDKRELNPLQAADICVYENAKEMVHFNVPGKRLRKTRISASALFYQMPRSFRYHTPDSLSKLGQR